MKTSTLLTIVIASTGAITIFITLFASYLFFTARRQFGDSPSGDRLKRIESSPQFNRETGRFQNEHPVDFQANMPIFDLLKMYIFGPEIRFPSAPLPSMKPDMKAFLHPFKGSDPARLIWLGHSSVLMNIAGKILLLDPTLSKRVAPVFFLGGRFQKPPLELDQLPHIDYLIISHDHYDHLDAESIRFFAKAKSKTTKVITALGVGAKLESFGVKPDQIIELDWWESFDDGGFKFTATPAQHFSGRGISDTGQTLWAGFAIRHDTLNLFFSGDTGYYSHFKRIGEKLGPFDFAILESGQYNLLWQYVHMLPAEVVASAKDLHTAEFMPIHWGMYNLSIHDWFEPISKVSKLSAEKGIPIRTPILGETIEVTPRKAPNSVLHPKWWEQHPDYIKRVGNSEPTAQ